ncbi:MAG: hypothetical protein OEN56_09405 [Gemmatimonadota bacterium]|nr:hypothetical protein [Gemmatimonadota bacterium]
MAGMVRSGAVRASILALIFAASAAAVDAQGGDGFLFREPRVAIKFETGYGIQRAQSDIFDFVIEEHTLDRRDFDSPYIGGEVSIKVAPRWDIAFAAGFQSASTLSEFREFVDQDDLPIEQVTELRLIPVTAAAKYYLRPRGRSIGRFAWIPESVVPFLSAGIGVVGYRFEQEGDFVDYETLDIFYDRFTTQKQTLLARGGAGVDVSIGRQFVLTGEARYGYARGELGADFSGFGDIDLDGLQLLAGVSVRF